MMNDLELKANNEKYFRSIRYFYHNLSKELKYDYAVNLAKYNIYLAAQCIMSSQKDDVIEKELIVLAESLARDFVDSENSARGFLALAELEQFFIISDLLKVVEKPTKTHFLVFKKIFESNNSQEIFIQFLEVLLSIKKISLVSYCISTFNGKIQVTNENRQVLNQLFEFLFENGNYGISKLILEKYDLFTDLKIIFNTPAIEVIHRLIDSKKRRIPAIKLAYEIYNRFNLIKELKSEIFLERLFELNSEKSLVIALNIAKLQNINDKRLNEQISNLLNPNRISSKVINKVKRKINKLISMGLLEYTSQNESLKEQFLRYEESIGYKFEEKHNLLEVPYFSKSEYSIYGDYVEIPKHKPIEEIVDEYFSMQKRPKLEILVNMLIFHFKSSYLEISHIFRKYQFSGIVKATFDYGFYVETTEIETRNLLFLHKAQVFEENENEVILSDGDVIQFRIIGINQKNVRFNISCLSRFAE